MAAERARIETAKCVALLSRVRLRMDRARAHLFGANRKRDRRDLAKYQEHDRAHESERMVGASAGASKRENGCTKSSSAG